MGPTDVLSLSTNHHYPSGSFVAEFRWVKVLSLEI